MFRVTNRMMFDNSLVNVFRQNQGILKAQEQLASGKRVNRPSDDPVAMSEIMIYQSRLGRISKYQEIGQKALSFLNTSESMVASVTDIGARAKELAMSQIGGASSAQTRITTAQEIDALIQHAISVGNTRIGSDYIFSGRNITTASIDANGLYKGDGTALTAEISEDSTVKMSVLASDFLAADLNPGVSSSTLLSSLRGGQGTGAGSFTITDRAGNTGTVSVAAGGTLGQVISAINSSGANVTASISPDGYGLLITDNTATGSVTGPLVITDVSGSVANRLGIDGSRAVQYFIGDDLNPSITSSTLVSDLLGGNGLTLNDISVVNGGTSATVSFAGASTIGDIINAINASGVSVTASINSVGTALGITSTNPSTVAYATDQANSQTAELLGIGGGRNAITNLIRLRDAMRLNDVSAIEGLVGNVNSAVEAATSVRGEIGALGKRVQSTLASLDASSFDTTTLLSNVQDADMAQAASDLALLQTAYQGTIKSTAAIIQPSLLDFLR